MIVGDAIAELEAGRAAVDLSSWWKISVRGADAGAWLNDLLTTDLDGLAEREARRSFLLTPTGKIRASVNVVLFEGGYLLLQDPTQPSRIDALLSPYVLSSDVALADRSDDLGLTAFPSATAPPASEATVASPSVLGPGWDVVGRQPSESGAPQASLSDVETWRIRRGIARFGVDLTTDSLPAEVELGDVIAHAKGCFLGQESVARVRNLGHPPFVLLAGASPQQVTAGEPLVAEGRDAGIVTSAAPADRGTALIARVRWALREAPLTTASGAALEVRGQASA